MSKQEQAKLEQLDAMWAEVRRRAKPNDFFKNRAIKKSIRKWERICQNIAYSWMILPECGLCHYVDREQVHPFKLNCSRCPLHQAGFGCLEQDSIFRNIIQVLSSKALFPNDRFFDLIETMYENVCSLMPEYDPYLEAKNAY